jgi:hypothetical protein
MSTTSKRTVCLLQAHIRMALIIQIRLAQHNLAAAEKEVVSAKSWAQDSLLAQLAEVRVLET